MTTGDGDIPLQGDSLSLRDLMGSIRRRSRLVWGSLLVFVVLGCLYLIIKTPVYTTSMVVGPAPASAAKGGIAASALSSSLSGILGASAPSLLSPTDEFMQLIISPRVAQKVIDSDPTVLPTFFAKEWDPVNKRWHPPHDPISLIAEGVYGMFGLHWWAKPSAERLSLYLATNLVISEVGTTAMQQVNLDFRDPHAAAALLNNLQNQADTIVREENANLADKQIQYLQLKLSQTVEVDYRSMLLGLLAQQVSTRMSINSSLPYAAFMVQVPAPTDTPTAPNPFIVLGVVIVVGGLFGVFGALTAGLVWPEGLPVPIRRRSNVRARLSQAVRYFANPRPLEQ